MKLSRTPINLWDAKVRISLNLYYFVFKTRMTQEPRTGLNPQGLFNAPGTTKC